MRSGAVTGMLADMLGEMRASLASGQMSAVEVTTRCLHRLEDLHIRTRCVAELDADRALATARRLDQLFARGGVTGPLHGVPFTVKDWIDVAGMRCSGG